VSSWISLIVESLIIPQKTAFQHVSISAGQLVSGEQLWVAFSKLEKLANTKPGGLPENSRG